MYTINLEYTTGSSFHSEETETTLSANWSLETAKINLQRIKAHYKAYSDRNAYVSCMMGKGEDALFAKIKKEPWYFDNPEWQFPNAYCNYWEFTIMLLEDDGTNKQYHCDWCGYFEHLHRARIVAVNPKGDDSDLEFEI
jgi:hypothetical protein